jgi:surfactin family lipopeptide synthetase A
MIEHQGVINRIEWMWRQFQFSNTDIVLQKTSITFDVSVWELFMPLCWGAKLVLCQKEYINSPKDLLSLINKEKITCLHFVPSMLNAFIFYLFDQPTIKYDLGDLRMVIASGEALSVETVGKWYEKVDIPLHNLYGPTEASIEVTYYTTSKNDTKIPIGRPIWNTRIYILGNSHQLLPIGVRGEICIAGEGLARGYVNKPDLTSDKFIATSIIAEEKMYKTGDWGRWLSDGNIEFLGRNDDQVKIRGHRIELAEIEFSLKCYPGISSSVVVARTNSLDEQELVSYIVCKETINESKIRSFISQKLPSFMLPGYIIQIESLPLSANGKLDRSKLPNALYATSSNDTNRIKPSNSIEIKLLSIWQEILGKENIGVKDNFFEIGGSSLKVIQLSKLISDAFKCDANASLLFQYSNIKDLANYLGGQAYVSDEKEFDRNEFLKGLDKFNLVEE